MIGRENTGISFLPSSRLRLNYSDLQLRSEAEKIGIKTEYDFYVSQ